MSKRSLDWLYKYPIAHRGLHDSASGVFENTLSAVSAALEANYSIEVDLQMSADGVPVVFHDYTLQRMTGQSGNMGQYTAAELGKIRIGATQDIIPTLEEMLNLVDGRSGLVLELKGQDPDREAKFASAVCKQLANYKGPVCVMSFKNWLVDGLYTHGDDIPVGLTAEGDDSRYGLHKEIDDRLALDFLSYGINDLPCKFASEFRASSRPVITWTVKSAEQAKYSAQYADQITFEGFHP
ncbi:MAG: glycerophosphodiester phosphodiesterase family protein [Rhizobiaceae bacterium]